MNDLTRKSESEFDANKQQPDATQSDLKGNESLKAEFYSGPMPHPSTLEEYEKVYPGAAKIIFDSFQEQNKHRIAMEKDVIRTGNEREILGIWFGFIIAMTTIVGGIYVYTKVEGAEWFGGGLSFSGLALLVGAFIYSKRSEANDRGVVDDK